MKNQNLVQMANVFYTNREKGIEKELYAQMSLEDAYEFCLLPSNVYNYVSNIGYRLEKIAIKDNIV